MLSLVLLASMLATQGPTGPTVKYKFESKQSTAMDLSSMGQGSQTIEMSSTSYVAVTLSDSAGGRIARLVFDSATVDAGPLAGMLPDSLLKMKPGTITRLFLDHGKVTPLDGVEHLGMAGAQLIPLFQMLFPRIPPGTKVGSSWADTTKADTTMTLPDSVAAGAGMSVGSKTITAWTVSSMDGDAFVMDAVTSGSTTMNMMGNDVQGTTNGKQRVTIGKDGIARAGTMSSKSAMAMAMAGNTIQMDITSTGALTKLP